MLDTIRSLIYRLNRRIDSFLGLDTYHLENGVIIRGKSKRFEDAVAVAEIKEWRSIPEMGFDLVEIVLVNGRRVRWFDKHNDLLGILYNSARTKKLNAGEHHSLEQPSKNE